MFENENLLIQGHPDLRNTHMAIKFSIKSSNLVFEPATACHKLELSKNRGYTKIAIFQHGQMMIFLMSKTGVFDFQTHQVISAGKNHVFEDQSAESCYRSSGRCTINPFTNRTQTPILSGAHGPEGKQDGLGLTS